MGMIGLLCGCARGILNCNHNEMHVSTRMAWSVSLRPLFRFRGSPYEQQYLNRFAYREVLRDNQNTWAILMLDKV